MPASTGKHGKRKNEGPSRIRYWATRRLEKRKVSRLFASGRFKTESAARDYWREHRKGRTNFSLYRERTPQ